MGVIIKDNKLAIITELETIHFELSKKVGNNLKQEIDLIIKHNKINQLLSKYKHENYIHEQRKQ